MTSPIDPQDLQLHRVRLVDLERYKAGIVTGVTAICGKNWSPTFPVNRMRLDPKCSICFPQSETNKIAIAR